MGSVHNMISEYENLRKSLSYMEKHVSALQEFQKNYPRWQDEYKNASAIQMAGKELLAMHGINKNLLGLQSIFEQSPLRAVSAIAEHQRIPKDFLPASDAFKQTGIQAFKNNTAVAIARSQEISRQNPLKDMVEKMGLSSSLGSMLNLIAEQDKLERNSVIRSIVGNSDFLSQISKQSPFISAMQSQIPKMEKIFGDSSAMMAMANSESLISSILPVATASLSFSSELDKLSVTEQQRVVDILEQINLDDEIDEEIQENLFAETRIDFSSYLESFQNFCKNNAFNIWALQTGYETFIKHMTENDFSNIFFNILFVICFLVLISNLPSGGDDK